MENNSSVNKTQKPNTQKCSSLKEALPQVLAVGVKNVLLLGFGMTLGFPTILIPSLHGKHPEETISLGSDAISWIGSINLICVPVGCLLSGAITQPLGRKRAMQLSNIPFLTAWLLFYFSTEAWHIFLALALTGLNGGLLEAPVLTYVAEITQPHLRGMLSSTSTMAVILGSSFQFLLGTFLPFRKVALVNCIVPIMGFILLMFVPETPLWLISKNRLEDAKKSLAWLRGWTTTENIEVEFQEWYNQLTKHQPDNCLQTENKPMIKKTSKMDLLKLLFKKNFLWPYFLVSLAFCLGHFNGMTILHTYAIDIFTTLKAPINKHYCTIILGVVEFIGCIACVGFVNYLGKRILNIASLLGCGLCFIIVATYAFVVDIKNLNSEKVTAEDLHWIPLTFLIISAFTSYLGIKILPWILTGEVFSNETRAAASGIASGTGYIFGFLANKIFYSMVQNLTLPGTFWFYGCVSFIGAIALYFILPETEGKTLFEITEHFAERGQLTNSVRRKKKVHGLENDGFETEETVMEMQK